MKREMRVVLLIVLLGTAGLVATFLAIRVGGFGGGNHAAGVHYTIIASERGFNDSVDHSGSWPVLNVALGERVNITVVNEENVESHGFVVDHYMPGGIVVGPKQSHTISFVADKAGTFRVYCNIFCLVHSFMQNGQLFVS
jgi:nitrous oxide reductase